MKNCFFRIDWEWEDEVYNEETEEYEMTERFTVVEVDFYFGYEDFIEMNVISGDELTETEEECILKYVDAHLLN
jgi:hypothetical protein